MKKKQKWFSARCFLIKIVVTTILFTVGCNSPIEETSPAPSEPTPESTVPVPPATELTLEKNDETSQQLIDDSSIMIAFLFSERQSIPLLPTGLPDLGVEYAEIFTLYPYGADFDTSLISEDPTYNATFVVTLKNTGIKEVENAIELLDNHSFIEYAQPVYLYSTAITMGG